MKELDHFRDMGARILFVDWLWLKRWGLMNHELYGGNIFMWLSGLPLWRRRSNLFKRLRFGLLIKYLMGRKSLDVSGYSRRKTMLVICSQSLYQSCEVQLLCRFGFGLLVCIWVLGWDFELMLTLLCASHLTLISKYLGVIFAIIVMCVTYLTLIRMYLKIIFENFCVSYFILIDLCFIFYIKTMYSFD